MRTLNASIIGTPLLSVENLGVNFGNHFRLVGLDLSLDAGEVLGVTGPNGSGKSTLINLISGVIRPAQGEIRFKGEVIDGLRPHQRVRRGIVRTFQQTRAFPDMSVYENVLLAALNGRAADRIGFSGENLEAWVTNVLERTFLYRQRLWSASKLSSGCLRRLEVARALATNPELLLLDEPFAALSAREERDVLALLAGLKQDGLTMLMVSHRLNILAELADRVLIMEEGRQALQGRTAQVLSHLEGGEKEQ